MNPGGPRLLNLWNALRTEQRMAAGAAALMFVTMFLPWYQQNAVVNAPRTAPLVSRNLSAFQVFSFVEAAVLLVALAVLYLLYARAEGRTFHLPGNDGTVILAAGVWVALLLVWRLFDKPGVISHGIAANVGIQWGIFFALACSGLLSYSGSRMRATSRPEPPLRRRRPRAPTPPMPAPARREPVAARSRQPRPPAAVPPAGDQLSFEDTPPPESPANAE
jgi:hypothetical protein